ncbi:MAG TPA: GerMN domain-containing protein [Ruminiclostridium sp.]|nr:GerMN domain-containing protein [Ruminiclostridium sp.]
MVLGIIITVLAGCGFNKGETDSDELTPVSSLTMGQGEADSIKDKTPVQLYFINEQGIKLAAETRYIQTTEASKGNERLATAILKELISGPAKGSLLKASIPKETKVLSDVKIKDGVATVDLSKDFIDKHPGGKKNEQLTLYSVVNTLTEIKDITSVQFRISGKVTKDFKGSYQIDVAYPRAPHLISNEPGKDSSTIKSEGQDNTKDNRAQPSKDDKAKKPEADTKTDADVDSDVLE